MAQGLRNVVTAAQKRPVVAAEENTDALLDRLEAWSGASEVDIDRLVRLLLDGDEPGVQLFNGAVLSE